MHFRSKRRRPACVIEPQDQSLFPNNWLRPRIHTSGADGATFQITARADREANDLVVYMKSNPYEGQSLVHAQRLLVAAFEANRSPSR